MITQEYLDKEIELAKEIYIYYFEKLADNISTGSNKYITWYKDLCSLYFICKSMLAVRISNGLLYLGDTTIEDSDVRQMSSDIREYLDYDLMGINYSLINPNPSPIPAPPVYPTLDSNDWKSAIVTVPTDDITMVVLPFYLIDTDPDSILITVSDHNPMHMVATELEGCHIVDNILYWHEYYNLKQGDRILFQYLSIS